jgi:PTS system nitrogen regulatory IIA component
LDIKDFLAPVNVILNMRATDKEQLLRDLSQRAAAALKLNDKIVAAEIMKREELGSTGMGEGIAIPHARIPNVETSFGILARLKSAVDFAAIDEKPVDLVFLLLLPVAPEGEQLNALASVARRLRNPAISSAIREAPDRTGAYEAITAT